MPKRNAHYLAGHKDLPIVYVYEVKEMWNFGSAHRNERGELPSDWHWLPYKVTPVVKPTVKATEGVTPEQAAAILGSLKGLEIDEMPF